MERRVFFVVYSGNWGSGGVVRVVGVGWLDINYGWFCLYICLCGSYNNGVFFIDGGCYVGVWGVWGLGVGSMISVRGDVRVSWIM